MSEKNYEEHSKLGNREKRIKGIAGRLFALAKKDIISIDTSLVGFKSRIGGMDVRLGRRPEAERHDYYVRASNLLDDKAHKRLFGSDDVGIHILLHDEGSVLDAWIGSVEDVEAMEEGEPHKKGFPERASDSQLLALQAALNKIDLSEQDSPANDGE